jgi:uncharacterized protein (DUF2384 family)
MNRHTLSKTALSREMFERSLVDQVKLIVRESGCPDGFSASKWVNEWINSPVPALGGRQPAELIETLDGQEVVSGLVARMQSGAFS